MRDFIKSVFASFVALLLFSAVGVGGLLLLLVAIAVGSGGSTVEDKTVLTFDLSLNITDAPDYSSPSQVLGDALTGSEEGQSITLRSALDALQAAAKDDRIVGLYLYSGADGGSSAGFATLTELRQALQAFRKADKPIIAYSTGWTESTYYLASIASRLLMDPSGLMELNGFRAETPFFAGAFQKYGIGVQVLRVGQYKSAVEPFTRTSRSPEDRLQTQKLLADLWNEFLTATAADRKVTPQQLQAIAEAGGLLLPSDAQANGLIDQVAYTDEVLPDLRKLTGQEKDDEPESFRQMSLSEYADTIESEGSSTNSSNRIALVYAEGDIVSGEGSQGQIGADVLARELRELRNNEEIKAIVLRINSPGGSATASNLVAREVKLTAAVKPMIVSMGTVAASGGYQIATYATQIFASPSTITGSIGVFGLVPNFQQISNNNGITWDVVKTGRYADIESISRPKTPQELQIAQRLVNQVYGQFLDTVAQGRSLPRQKVDAIAQGRVWSGVEAKRIGLVDELGGVEAAIQAAAKAAKLGDDWQIEEYPRYRSFEEQLVGSLFSRYQGRSPHHIDGLDRQIQQFKTEVEALKALNDPHGIYSRLIFVPQIR